MLGGRKEFIKDVREMEPRLSYYNGCERFIWIIYVMCICLYQHHYQHQGLISTRCLKVPPKWVQIHRVMYQVFGVRTGGSKHKLQQIHCV